MAKRAQRKNIKKYKTTKILDYFGVAFLIVNIVVDILSVFIDPRIGR